MLSRGVYVIQWEKCSEAEKRLTVLCPLEGAALVARQRGGRGGRPPPQGARHPLLRQKLPQQPA
jgi:hypothetical protein